MYFGIDPFAVKRHSKINPIRLAFTAYARVTEQYARMTFGGNAAKIVTESWPAAADYAGENTAVTPEQMAALLHFAKKAEAVPGPLVEIGSFRGVTTSMLAGQTQRTIHAVDPFREYGGAEEDFAIFRTNTANLANVVHHRETSGSAARGWDNGPICFVFVDAVHDYVNTIFDTSVWSQKLSPGGYLAMHDVDNQEFSGTRLAAAQMQKHMTLVCHVQDLIILQKA